MGGAARHRGTEAAADKRLEASRVVAARVARRGRVMGKWRGHVGNTSMIIVYDGEADMPMAGQRCWVVFDGQGRRADVAATGINCMRLVLSAADGPMPIVAHPSHPKGCLHWGAANTADESTAPET